MHNLENENKILKLAREHSNDYHFDILKFKNPIPYDISNITPAEFEYYFRTPAEFEKWNDSRITHRGVFATPWIDSKECIEYIENWIRARKISTGNVSMFEWGIGGSTIYFGKDVSTMVTVEHSIDWIYRVKSYIYTFSPEQLQKHAVIYNPIGREYENAIDIYEDGEFDIIMIDGHHRSRNNTFKKAISKLKSSGMMVVDNMKLLRQKLDGFDIKAFSGDTSCLHKNP